MHRLRPSTARHSVAWASLQRFPACIRSSSWTLFHGIGMPLVWKEEQDGAQW